MHPISYTTKRIRLSITEKCNLRCTYCFEENKNYRTIDLETAKRIVEEELTKPSSFELVIFDLFGGEPFLEFDLLRELCESTWARSWNRKYLFWTTTNGTLVHGDIQKWVYENRHRLYCGLSLDGPREVHNRNRTNSFDKIDINFFKNTWPDRPVRSVIAENSIQDLYESVVFLQEQFKRVKVRLAFGVAWDYIGVEEILEDQLTKLVQYYTDHPEYEVCSMLDIDFTQLRNAAPEQCCGVGFNHCAYDVDGTAYPCAQFQSLCREYNLAAEDVWSLNFKNRQNYLPQKCKDCCLKDICKTCYAFCYVHRDDSIGKCGTFKLMVYKAAQLRLNRLAQKGDSMTDKDKQIYDICRGICVRMEENNWTV